jgi:hypothetical protein
MVEAKNADIKSPYAQTSYVRPAGLTLADCGPGGARPAAIVALDGSLAICCINSLFLGFENEGFKH